MKVGIERQGETGTVELSVSSPKLKNGKKMYLTDKYPIKNGIMRKASREPNEQRGQSQTRLSYAERKQPRPKVKTKP